MRLWQLVCSGRCTGRELWEQLLVKDGKGNVVEDNRPSIIPYPVDKDGFTLCPFCKKILGNPLSQCPVCDKWYKGYKPYPKYHFPCSDCE